MKKVYINESQVNKEFLLPKFLFDAVKVHNTSLGDNPAFPGEDDYPFDYAVLKERFKDVCNQMKDIGIPLDNTDVLKSELSDLVRTCKEMEKPVRDALEKLCENAINRLFAIPDGAVNIKCKLVDKVTYKISLSVTPEASSEKKYKFKDIADFELSKAAVAKRRFINALIMGASKYYSSMITLYQDELNKINPNLIEIYDRIMTLNEYLLFTTKEEMTDEKPKQGSYVEVKVGSNGKKNTIESQGVIFPLLFHDTIKGFFELFSVHGLPDDIEKTKYIIGKADFLLAEPWDMRLGVKLWQMIFDRLELADNTNIIPYIFTYLVMLPYNEFNSTMKEILAGTEAGDEIMAKLIDKATANDGYHKFKNRINARNIDRSVIADSYFTASELDGFDIESDEDGDVIEEDSAEAVNWNGKSYNMNKDEEITFFIMNDGSLIHGKPTKNESHEELMIIHFYKLIDRELPTREFDGKLDYMKAYDGISFNQSLYSRLWNSVEIQGRVFITDDGNYVFTCYDPLDEDEAKQMMTYCAFKMNLPNDKCYYVGHYNTVIIPLVDK